MNGDEEDVDCGGSACSPCGDARIVFVTSQQYHAALGGVAGADQICQSHAAAAGLPGTFLAWLTDAAGAYAPSVRFDQGGGPFVRTDEVFVALDWADLTDGTLAASISLDEFGGDEWAVGDEYQLVWSNVSRRGTSRTFLNDDCVGWTDASIGQEYGGYGMYLRTDYHWSDSFHIFCHLPLRLYCMQQ